MLGPASMDPTVGFGPGLAKNQGRDFFFCHGQNMTVVAKATAETTTFSHLSRRAAMRRQSFWRPTMISVLVRRLSCLMGLPRVLPSRDAGI